MNSSDSRRKLQEDVRSDINNNNRLWHNWDSLDFSRGVLDVIRKLLPNLAKEMRQHHYKIPKKEKIGEIKFENVIAPINTIVEKVAKDTQTIKKDIRELENILNFQMPSWFDETKNFTDFSINDLYLKDSDGFDLILSIRQNVDFWSKTNIDEHQYNTDNITKSENQIKYMDASKVRTEEVPNVKKNKKIYWIVAGIIVACLIALIVCLSLFFAL